LTQCRSQFVNPCWQLSEQTPWEHTSDELQAIPQAPQLKGSLDKSTQEPPHEVVPPEQPVSPASGDAEVSPSSEPPHPVKPKTAPTPSKTVHSITCRRSVRMTCLQPIAPEARARPRTTQEATKTPGWLQRPE